MIYVTIASWYEVQFITIVPSHLTFIENRTNPLTTILRNSKAAVNRDEQEQRSGWSLLNCKYNQFRAPYIEATLLKYALVCEVSSNQ